MHSVTASFAIIVAVCLIHFSYADFRFRHRGGVMWFWLVSPAPFLLWTSRGAALATLLVAAATAFIGVSLVTAIFIAGLLLIHIGTLIVVEIREESWVPPAEPLE